MFPTAGVNRVFGLLDLLRAYNGKTDVANLTIDLRIALDELLPIIDTAEYLGLVDVQKGDISLTDLGKRVLDSRITERKKLVHERLVGLEPFADLIGRILEVADHERVSVLLELLGRSVRVEVPALAVEAD